jgi:hypothetical protein
MSKKLKLFFIAFVITDSHFAEETPVKNCRALSQAFANVKFDFDTDHKTEFLCNLCDKGFYVSDDQKSCESITTNEIENCEDYVHTSETYYHCKRCEFGYYVSKNLKECHECGIEDCKSCELKDQEVLCKACSLGKVPDGTRKACIENAALIQASENCLIFEHYAFK